MIPAFDESQTLAIHVVPARGNAINVVDTLLRAHDNRPPSESRFAALHAWASERVRLVGAPAEAGLVLYPSAYADDLAGASAAAEAAERAGRTCLFFDAGDTWTPFALSRGILYRTSCDRAAMRPNERAMPAFVGDVIAEGRALDEIDDATLGPAPRAAEPSVGFVGYVGTPVGRAKALATLQLHKYRGLSLRRRAVDTLRRTPGIRVDADARATFGGGAHADANRRAERVAFLRNLFANAYTLCLRGKGNFSFRFYEVLSAGRVPLFVDTRCVLPFEDELDWRSLLAWCDVGELKSIGDRVRAFGARLDDKAFARQQETLRDVWTSHCSPLGFVRQLSRRHAS